jgi:hypothetical protein
MQVTPKSTTLAGFVSKRHISYLKNFLRCDVWEKRTGKCKQRAVICYWPSPAQSFLVSASVETNDHRYVRSIMHIRY